MSVFICDTDADDMGDCERCECDVGDCSKHNFGDWMQYNCNGSRGDYLKLTNKNRRRELVICEVEAFGEIGLE